MEFSEIKSLIDQQGEAIQSFRDGVYAKIDEERKEREALEARINRGGLGGTKAGNADPEFKALDKLIRSGDEAELKSMSVGSDPDGGYTVLPVMSQTMTTRLYDATSMRRLARVETLTTGDAFEEIDDRGEAEATWTGESSARINGATPKLGKWSVPVEEIYALQPVTQRLLDDTNRNLGVWMESKISDKFARTEGAAFISGDGILKPKGFLSYNKVTTADFTRPAGELQYVASGHASTLGTNPADKVKSLMWSLRAPYRTGAVWLMNSNTASTLDQIKDGAGNYIWRSSMSAGVSPTLLGYPVEFDEGMPDIGADEYPIAFGNFKLGYCIADKTGVKFLRDPYTDKPNVLFYAYKRVGGGLANDDAIKLLKIAAS